MGITWFMHCLPTVLIRTHSSTVIWPVPGPEGLLEVMTISFPHGVQLPGISPAGYGAAQAPHTRDKENTCRACFVTVLELLNYYSQSLMLKKVILRTDNLIFKRQKCTKKNVFLSKVFGLKEKQISEMFI